MSCFSDVCLWRQCFILLTESIHSIGVGILLSYPGVFNAAVLSANSTNIKVTPSQASWIATSQGFFGPIGFALILPIMQVFGRRAAHIITNSLIGIGFLIFAFSENLSALYIGRIFQELSISGVHISSIILGEYAHPRRRGYFITIKKCTLAFGILLCHSTSLCWTWREIAILGVIPNVLVVSFILWWPESPHFLALKGRYENCTKVYIWLYGDTVKTKTELEELISAQKERKEENKNRRSNFKKLMRKLIKRDFLISFAIASLLIIIVDASGRYYMQAYIIQILTEVIGEKSVAVYCTIGADVLILIALLISSFVIRRFNRRTILFTAGIFCVSIMFLTSILAYSKFHYNIGAGLYWLITAVILINVFIVNVGIVPASYTIISEIFPLEHKGVGSFASGLVFTGLYGLLIKYTPVMIEKLGIQGTFAIYGVCVLISLLILYFLLNETKDKTLQAIENEMKDVKGPVSSLNTDKLLPS